MDPGTPVMEKCNDVSLVGIVVASEEDAFSSCNDYAFRLRYSVRKDKKKFKAGNSMKFLKHFYCHKQGNKYDKEKKKRSYTKVDIRTDCKAMIEFHLNDEAGKLFVPRYEVQLVMITPGYALASPFLPKFVGRGTRKKEGTLPRLWFDG
ncbi:hypothetical protein M9H77_12847 [Catharanthus roseus]|uniref:Uncharacterized protein n=1 Tax=Catharanthus roseus TaxID=4058 RepID=A0ACC0BIP9_CATRO|nr:hypothetical protein M9H77_12847 [Catharanthus roseus]